MRGSIFVVASALVLMTGAAYADDPMATTYANTVTSKNVKTGAVVQLLFNADGSYSTKGMGPNGQAFDIPGKWAAKDNGATLCLMPQSPANATNVPATSCSPLAVHPLGEHWTVSNDQGDSFDVVVSAGR